MNQNNLKEGLEDTSGLPDGLVYFKGQIVPKALVAEYHRIYDWNVKEDVVWVCSFPKSGTTWTQEMVWMIINDLDFERGKIEIDERSPYLEQSFSPNEIKMKMLHNVNLSEYAQDSIQYAKDLSKKERLCIMTHLQWDLLPRQIQEGTKQSKIIYVTRNPKDVCVSLYHHVRIMSGYAKSFEKFVEAFWEEKMRYMPYWRSVLSYWEQRKRPNVLFLKYEEMIEDLPSTIRKVAKFIGKELRDDQVEILTDHLSFANMKKNPSVNREKLVQRKRELHSVEGTFMRKGKAGSYKETMSEEMIEKFDEWIEKNVEGTGFSV